MKCSEIKKTKVEKYDLKYFINETSWASMSDSFMSDKVAIELLKKHFLSD